MAIGVRVVQMRKYIRVMKAVSDPSRVRILKLLHTREFCVCELQELLGLAQSSVSKHLRLLENAGLIIGRREGAWVIYAISSTPETEYAATMLANIENWLNDDEEFVDMKKRSVFINRMQISY